MEVGEYVWKLGDKQDKLFFLAEGKVEISFYINDRCIFLNKKEQNYPDIEDDPVILPDEKVPTFDDIHK